jgi:hypothetical protein
MVKRSLGLGLVAGLALAGAAMATEGGGGAYPNGAEDFMTGALPPPGNYSITYFLYYEADHLKDSDGNNVPIDFDLNVAGPVFRLVHVQPTTWLGAYAMAQHVFIPTLYTDVTTPMGSDSNFGLGDVIANPLILGWKKGNLFSAVGLDVYLPMGDYNEGDLANIGRNYWTFEPVAAFTWLNPIGCELSAKLMYDVNTENRETDYDSGDEFHTDVTLGKHWGGFAAGLNGFYYQQVTDDTGPGAPEDGNKGKQIGWGPAINYQYKMANLTVKYQDEIETENKPEGSRLWLKVIFPF